MWGWFCSDLTPPALVTVTFNVDASDFINDLGYDVDTLTLLGPLKDGLDMA